MKHFNFSTVEDFDNHISSSICGYDLLHDLIINISSLLENVSGLAKGNARAYLKEIVESVSRNYRVQIFLLNAATMGIPQMRTRVFVIGINRVYEHLPKLQLDFDCPRIGFEITAPYWNDPDSGDYSIERFAIGRYWDETEIGAAHRKHFSLVKPHLKKPCNTLTQTAHQLGAASVCHPIYKRKLNKNEMRLISTFPKDYNYLDCHPANIMGRSVLPVMMANISYQIYKQWLSKI